jgi:hypothetical protein
MFRQTTGRLPVFVMAAVAVVGLASTAEASFFRNRPVPPTGTGPDKEVDPPVTPPPVNRVPEPGTMVLAAIGAGAVAAWKRRKKAAD